MKKIIKLGMVALTALTMAGCSSESEDVEQGTITIAGDGSFTWAPKVSALALDEDYPVS